MINYDKIIDGLLNVLYVFILYILKYGVIVSFVIFIDIWFVIFEIWNKSKKSKIIV